MDRERTSLVSMSVVVVAVAVAGGFVGGFAHVESIGTVALVEIVACSKNHLLNLYYSLFVD